MQREFNPLFPSPPCKKNSEEGQLWVGGGRMGRSEFYFGQLEFEMSLKHPSEDVEEAVEFVSESEIKM